LLYAQGAGKDTCCTAPIIFLQDTCHLVNVPCCPCCSGKFPPIPAHYSNDLKELVEALIKKEPEARPSLQEILDLAYVRRHMQLYRDHVARHITERQTSFQRSLSQFNLEAMAQVCFHPAILCERHCLSRGSRAVPACCICTGKVLLHH